MFGGYVKKHYICSAISGESPHSLRYRTTTFFNQLNYKPLKNKTIMKKILLTAVIAMLGISAFAALPKAGDKGYLYNPASGMFINKDAKLAATGDAVTVINEGAAAELEGAEYFRFEFSSGNRLNFNGSAGLIGTGTSYAKFVVKETEKGLIITHLYPNAQGPEWMRDPDLTGTFIVANGEELGFKAFEELDDFGYWQFIDAQLIDGPTYPIALTLPTAADKLMTVEWINEPYSATFTPTADLQNSFKIVNLDVTDFVKYGYKKIVIEFAEPVADGWNVHAYGEGNDPFFSVKDATKYEVDLSEGNLIHDLTAFNWFGCRAPITISALYFSKYAVGEEPEPEPEPEPVATLIPADNAKGYLYNINANKFVTAEATLGEEGVLFDVKDEGPSEGKISWSTYTTEYPGRTFYLRRFYTNERATALSTDGGITCTTMNGYAKWAVYEVEGEGLLLVNLYTRNDFVQGQCLGADESGALTLVEEAEAPYWKFLSQEEYEAIATSISSVTEKTSAKGIFNVAGQQVKVLQKGLNIVDGKKVYVK